MHAGSHHLWEGFVGRHAAAGVLDRVIEILHIHARAWAAAHQYERLKRLSDADLAERGLRRADLPRAAFRALTGQA